MQRAACNLLRQKLSSIATEKLLAFVPAASETAADCHQKILGQSVAAIAILNLAEKNNDQQLSEAQLIFETPQQIAPNLLLTEANSQKETLKMQLHFAKVQEQINCTFQRNKQHIF
ncbi:MAG: hypothetical protein U7126_25110 [Microcoleus sp.]